MSISYAVFCLIRPPPISTLFPYTTLFRSRLAESKGYIGADRGVFRRENLHDIIALLRGASIRERYCLKRDFRLTQKLRYLTDRYRHLNGLRPEEHTSELQSHVNLVCRLLLDTTTTYIYTLSLHDALPISSR